MSDSRQEITLAKVRLHWGIFIPAIIVVLVMCLPALLWFIVISQFLRLVSGQIPSFPFLTIFLPGGIFGAFCLLLTWAAYRKSEIVLTNRRLIFRTGLLSRVSGELPLENVESIFIIEPLIGRLCGYGTVTVTSIGGRAFPLRCIGSPQTFHATLQKAVANAKAPSRPLFKSPEATPPPQDDDSRYMPKG